MMQGKSVKAKHASLGRGAKHPPLSTPTLGPLKIKFEKLYRKLR